MNKLTVVLGMTIFLICFSVWSKDFKRNVIVKNGQIFLIELNGERQLTDDNEKKFLPALEPFEEQKVVYHTEIKQDIEPSTNLIILDIASGKTVKKLPFNQSIRKIKTIGWLSHGLLGIEFWNRGNSLKYSVMNSKNGNIVSTFLGNHFSISKDRKKVVFTQGIPGGHIPNLEDKTLEVMMCNFSTWQNSANSDKSNNQKITPSLIYSTRGMLGEKGIHTLEANVSWSPDSNNIAFIDKHGDQRKLVVVNIKETKKPHIKKLSLDAKIKKVKKINWKSKKILLVTDQNRTWDINLDTQ